MSPRLEDFSTAELWIEPSREEQALAAIGISKRQIKRAGEILAALDADSNAKAGAYATIEEWRASHSYPLRAVHTVLTSNARKINQWAFTSGRLKRMESIAFKLQRQQGKMDLNQMNDVAGCRAVLWQIEQVPRLIARLEKHFALGGPFKPKLYDYLQEPKPDGYRGIHLAIQYQSKNPKHADWCGKRVEIQIRSTLQHAWATAVEAVDLFANEKLKLGQGSASWSRFFALASSVFARSENNSPIVPGTPASEVECVEELRSLWLSLRVPHLLTGWMTAVGHTNPVHGAVYLLTVDTALRQLRITPFGPEYIVHANTAYASAEQEDRGKPDQKSVLVAVDKIIDLRNAFPNYYADTRDFLKELRDALNDYSDLSTNVEVHL